MTLEEINAILTDVTFGHWRIRAYDDPQCVEIGHHTAIVSADAPHMYLQVSDPLGICNITGAPMAWSGRKWFLSIHMTKSEIVQTAFKAVMTAIEHEAREKFKYRGESIFDPHYDVDRLLELRRSPDALDAREAA